MSKPQTTEEFLDSLEPVYVVMSNKEIGEALRKMNHRIETLEADLKLTKLKLAVAEETLSSTLGVLTGRL